MGIWRSQMDRRSFLKASASTVAATTLLAGCLDDNEGGVSDNESGKVDASTSTKQPSTTTTKTPTQTATATEKQADVEILNHELTTLEYGNTVVSGMVKNTTDKTLAYVEVTAKFFDANDVRLGEGVWNASDVSAGQKLEIEVMPMFSDTDAIDHYEIEASAGF